MIKKLSLGTLIGSIAATIVSSIWFVGLFGSKADQWLAENADCARQMDDMPYWAWILAILVLGFIGALALDKLKIKDALNGGMAGLVIYLLIGLVISLFTYVSFKAYELNWMPLDIIGNTLSGIAGGAAIGWLYGKLK
ncbi:MAG: hypothetical protein KDC57_04045 [Saprospiraceae bacterium]|nr:hypothetical protein [Saprospiraceae bacterium]